MLKMIEDCYK